MYPIPWTVFIHTGWEISSSIFVRSLLILTDNVLLSTYFPSLSYANHPFLFLSLPPHIRPFLSLFFCKLFSLGPSCVSITSFSYSKCNNSIWTFPFVPTTLPHSPTDSDISQNTLLVCHRQYMPVPERQNLFCGHPGIGQTFCETGQSFHLPILFLQYQDRQSYLKVFLPLILLWAVHSRNYKKCIKSIAANRYFQSSLLLNKISIYASVFLNIQ